MSHLIGTIEFKVSTETRRNYLSDLLRMPQELRNELKRLDIINLWKLDKNGSNGIIQLLNTNLREEMILDMLKVLYENHIIIFEYLLSQITNERNTFLICCIEKQKYEIAKWILQVTRTMKYHANSSGKNILLTALSQSNADMALYILENGFEDLSLIDTDGNSALMYACMNHMEDVALKLFDCGIAKCFPEYVNKKKWTALYHCLMSKMENFALKLIRSGHANVGHVGIENTTMLNVACMGKMENIVLEILQHHQDSVQLELPDDHQQTAFMNCICFLNEDICLKFLDTGRAAEHLFNSFQETPLMIACSKGMEKLALRLVQSGNVPLDILDKKDNCSALSVAIDNDCFSVAYEILETTRGNPNIIDKYDETAFILACQKKSYVIASYMLERNLGFPTYVNKHDESALYYCALNDWKDLTEKLASMMPFDFKNMHDKKVLDICRKNGYQDLVEVILEKMTDTEFLRRENEFIERMRIEKIQNELLLEEAREKERVLLKKQKELEKKKAKKASPSNSPKHLTPIVVETPPIIESPPTPVVVKSPPKVKAVPAPVVVKSPPKVKAVPAPVVVKSPTPEVKDVHTPVVVKSPTPEVKDVHTPVVVKTTPLTAQVKIEDMSPRQSKKNVWEEKKKLKKHECETANVWKRNQKVESTKVVESPKVIESKFFDSPQVVQPVVVETPKEEILWIIGVPIKKEEPFMFAFHESTLPQHEYDDLVARKVLGYIDIY